MKVKPKDPRLDFIETKELELSQLKSNLNRTRFEHSILKNRVNSLEGILEKLGEMYTYLQNEAEVVSLDQYKQIKESFESNYSTHDIENIELTAKLVWINTLETKIAGVEAEIKSTKKEMEQGAKIYQWKKPN